VGVKVGAVHPTDLLVRIERAYDAFPRLGGAVVERVGGFDLFLPVDGGWPYYARPHLGATAAAPADLAEVRARQRRQGVPEALEWVHELSPALLAMVRAAGMPVLLCPLMVFDAAVAQNRPGRLQYVPHGLGIRTLDPTAAAFADEFAVRTAVAEVAFGHRGTANGPIGPAERDAAVRPVASGLLDYVCRRARTGSLQHMVAETADGIVATGGVQFADDAAEIVGVATLPSARRHGIGAALSAALCRLAQERGADLVFLSAAEDDVARVYGRIGFRRVGTACIAEG
jgi:ribosomal protein S18 acetylase RimI-like enzyme